MRGGNPDCRGAKIYFIAWPGWLLLDRKREQVDSTHGVDARFNLRLSNCL